MNEADIRAIDQDDAYLESLGEGTNAIVWPRPIVDEDEEIDPVESPENQRLMRIGPPLFSASHLMFYD